MDNTSNNDPNAFLMGGGGGRSAKFDSVGAVVSGIIIETPRLTQQTEYGTNKPKVWDNGDPMMQLVVTVQTELREETDDDGLRNFYLRGGSKREDTNQGAVARAVAAVGASGLEVGGRLSIAYIGNDASGSGNPRKRYAAKYERPVVPVGDADPFGSTSAARDPFAATPAPRQAAPAADPFATTASAAPAADPFATQAPGF